MKTEDLRTLTQIGNALWIDRDLSRRRTVETIEAAFGHVNLHEAVKAGFAIRLVEEHCSFGRLLERLRLPVRA